MLRWLPSTPMLLACLLACQPRVGHPRLRVEVTGVGDEGSSLSFSIGADGRFRKESRGDIGNGTIAWTKCHGSLAPDQVAGLFASVDAARLTDKSQTFTSRAGSRERSTITFEPSIGRSRFPADADEFARLDTLLSAVREQANRSDPTCKEGREAR